MPIQAGSPPTRNAANEMVREPKKGDHDPEDDQACAEILIQCLAPYSGRIGCITSQSLKLTH